MSSPVLASTASAFLSSIGVNTHLNDNATEYGNIPGVLSELQYLGVSRIRDDTPKSWTLSNYESLAVAGIKLDLFIGYDPGEEMGNGGIQSDLAMIANIEGRQPGSIIGLEGLNEPNNFPNTWNGHPTDNWTTVEQVQQAEYGAVGSMSAFAGVPLLDASVNPNSFSGTPPDMAFYSNLGNAHVYPYNGGQPTLVMNTILAGQAQLVPGKPAWITEFGYSSSYEDPSDYGVSQDVQAKNTLNGLLDAYKDGVPYTFIYELNDETANPSLMSLEDGFGLFSYTGVPTPAAVGLHNLTTILADTGRSAPTFTPGSLNYTITNLPGVGNSLLLEKSNGTFDIVVWNEAVDWNYQIKSDVAVAPTAVTVNLGESYQTVQIYDPLSGSSPISTFSNVSSIPLIVTDHPLIIQVLPAQSAEVIGATGPSGTMSTPYGVATGVSGLAVTDSSTADVLHATLKSANGTMTAMSATDMPLAGSGTSTILLTGTAAQLNAELQTASFTGTVIGDGSAALQISNDAGGTANASENFTVSRDTISLSLSEDAYKGNAEFMLMVDGTEIGRAQTVTAFNSSGHSQVFALNGQWGAHPVISVEFINDLYGGSPQADRNLYVNNIKYNGISQMPQSVELMWNSSYEVKV
jgi:Ca-dependent carbohydrate-binding module xylan-binding